MKKLRLLLAFCALLLGWSNASAQKDVTSQYITNATLSDGLTGWTVNNFNDPVRGNNTTGFASECYAGWGSVDISTYSLKQTITLPAGNYRLVNYSFYRYGANDGVHNNLNSEKSLCYLCAGSKKEKIKTLNSITDAASLANNQAEGANCFDSKMYRNVVEFTIASDNTEIEIGLEGTHEVTAGWIIAGMFELFDLDDLASVSSPTDVTYAIKNSGFEYRNLAGWTTTTSSDNKTFWYMDNTALSGKAGIGWVESYQGGGIPNGRSIYQNLTGLDNGLYEVTVYGHLQQGSGSDGFYLYANSDRVAIGSTDKDYSVRTTVTDGTLRIKLGTEGCNGNWAAFDKVRLQFYGDPLAAYQDLLDEVVEKAQALVDGNTIPDAAESALQTVINNNDNDDHAFTEESQFNTAMDNINAAYDTYKALEPKYAIWLEVKAGATAMKDIENNNPTATSTLNTAIGTQNTAAENATTNDGLNTAIAALRSAISDFIEDATPTSGNRFDITCLLTNHDLTGLPTWQQADGWYTEQSGGNSQVMSGSNKYFYEYWSDSASPATSGYTVYLKTTLPKGVYSMAAQAFATDQRSEEAKAAAATVNGITFSANDVDGTTITSDALAAASISFYQAAASEVKLGLKAHTGNTRNWMGIGYVQLFKVANDQAAGVYATVRSSANAVLESDDYTNVTGKERSDLATLAAVETPADYVDAIEALQEANSAFVSAKTSYDNFVAAKAAEYEDNLPYASSAKFAAIGTAQAAADATSASDAEAKTNAIISAYRKYVESNALAEGVGGIDKTNLISDANFSGVTIEDMKAGAWSFSQTGGTPAILNGESFTDGDGNANYSYFDYYNNGANNQNLSQTLTALPKGQYLLTVTARATTAMEGNYYLSVDFDETSANEAIPAIGNTGGTFGRGWNDVSVVFNHVSDGDVTIHVYGQNGKAGWSGATRFRLAKIDKVATIGSTGWTTFASPYALDLSSMTASSGEVAAYYASATSAESVTVLPIESSAVQAGEGLLLKGTAGATITIPVVASGDAISGNLMVGCPTATNITSSTPEYGTCYVLGVESEKAVFQNVKNYIDGGNTVNIPAGKAYLNATASNGARSMRIVFGDITGVANVEAASEAKAKDGKFIENGKLVIVKNGKKFNANGQQVK